MPLTASTRSPGWRRPWASRPESSRFLGRGSADFGSQIDPFEQRQVVLSRWKHRLGEPVHV